MNKLFCFIFSFLPEHTAYAHCDIPCGIYDPHSAQVGAHTVIRMTKLIEDLHMEADTIEAKKDFGHTLARCTQVKEEHGELVEKELGTLENDYFKEEHFKTYTDLRELIATAIKLSIKTRQTIDMTAAEELLEKVLKIAEIFYKTKNLEPVRVKSPYPTEREIVIYK